MSCYSTPCNCITPCTPTPCVDGCLMDLSTNCVQLSQDLVVCTDTLVKGTTVTNVLANFANKLCGNITVTVLDIKAKASSSDTTSDYLGNKLVGSTSIVKSTVNPAGNEQIKFDVIRDTVTGGGNNALTIGVNGIYVPPSSTSSSTTVAVAATTNTFIPTVNTVSGGYTVGGNVKVDTTTGGNILASSTYGLYVPPYTPSPSLSVAPENTASINTFVNLVGTTYKVSSLLRLDPSSTASVTVTSAGLRVNSATTGSTLITKTNSTSVDLTVTSITGGYNIYAEAHVDTITGGNALVAGAFGLYVPTPALSFGVGNTNSVDMILTGSTITSNLKKQNSQSINLTIPNALGLQAEVRLDMTTGGGDNALSIGPNGLYASFAISGTCAILDVSIVTFALYENNGEVYIQVTPIQIVDHDMIRVRAGYTRPGVVAASVSALINMGMTTGGSHYIHLPGFDVNSTQTIPIEARRLCSELHTTSYSTAYSPTIGYVAPAVTIGTWTAIPAGYFSAGMSASGTATPQYKISKDRKELALRGFVNTNLSMISNGLAGYNSATTSMLSISALLAVMDSNVAPTGSLSTFRSVTNLPGVPFTNFQSPLITLTVAAGVISIQVIGYNNTGVSYDINEVSVAPIILR